MAEPRSAVNEIDDLEALRHRVGALPVQAMTKPDGAEPGRFKCLVVWRTGRAAGVLPVAPGQAAGNGHDEGVGGVVRAGESPGSGICNS